MAVPRRQGSRIGNDEQLWLMSQVKHGHMTIDEAVNWKEVKESELRMNCDNDDDVIKDKSNNAGSNQQRLNQKGKTPNYNLRKAKVFTNILGHHRKNVNKYTVVTATEDARRFYGRGKTDDEKIYNFIVFSQRKLKQPTQKRIMQIDFDGKQVSLIEQGRITKTFKFSSMTSADGQDSKKILINFDDNHPLDVVMETLSDKIKIIRLLHLVVEQNDCDTKGIHLDPSRELEKKFTVIKEGHLDKQESYGSSITWIKRLVTVCSGELTYHRIEDDEDSSALNVIRLHADVITITIVDDAIFTITTLNQQTYQFKVTGSNSKYYREIRDEWISAIKKACQRSHYKQQSTPPVQVIKKNTSNNVKVEKSSNILLNGLNKVQKEVEEYRTDLMTMSEQDSGIREINHKIDNLTSTLSHIRQIIIQNRFMRSQSMPETPHITTSSKNIGNGGRVQRAFNTLFSRRNARSPPRMVTVAQQFEAKPATTTISEVKGNPQPQNHRHNERKQHHSSMTSLVTMVESDRITSFDPPTSSPPEVDDVIDDGVEAEVDDKQQSAEVQPDVDQIVPEVEVPVVEFDEEAANEEESEETDQTTTTDEMTAMMMTSSVIVPLPPSLPAPPPPLLTTKQIKKKQKGTMRVIHVTPVPHDQISGSLWERLQDVKYLIEHQQLYEDFSVKVKKKAAAARNKEKTQPIIDTVASPNKLKNVTYLDPKMAQNLGIFLSGFKFRKEILISKLSTVEEKCGGLSSDHVISLSKFCPEPDLRNLYEKHLENPQVLTKEDLFMMELCHIPKLAIRLDILKHLRELPQEIEIIEPELELVFNACNDLLNSDLFELFLTYLLAATNHINSCNIKGESKGLRLSSLQQAYMTRTNDREGNLLIVLIRIIKEKTPQIINLPHQLSNISKAKLFSIKGLRAELDVMRKGLQQVRKNSEFLRRKKNQIGSEICKFCEHVEVTVTKQECDLDRMDARLQQVHDVMHRVIVKFGESPNSQSQQLFGFVDDFLNHFKNSLLSNAS